MSTYSAHRHMAEDTAVSTKIGGTSKSTTGSMRLSQAGGPAARAGFPAAADTVEVDENVFFVFWVGSGEFSTLRLLMKVPNEPGLRPNNGLQNVEVSDQSMASKMSSLMDHL